MAASGSGRRREAARPCPSADQRYGDAYLFGAIRPRSGKGAALLLPKAKAQAMQMRLEAIGRKVAARAQAVVLVGRAGRRNTFKLKGPKNLRTILPPSRAPEPNPVESIRQSLRRNRLSNRVFEDYQAILEAGCAAWKRLIAAPRTITSIGSRDWAHAGQGFRPLVSVRFCGTMIERTD